MSATPLLDRVLDALARDIELERLLREASAHAGWGVLELARAAFVALVEHEMPRCSGDEWKLLSYLWGQTWGQGRGAHFTPLSPFQMMTATGLPRAVVFAALDGFVERGLLEWRRTSSPDGESKGTAYRLRIPSLEVE